jgi:pantothenate kinase type III
MSDLVLVIDVGNSGAKIGAVRGEDVAGPVRLPQVDGKTVREFAAPMLKGQQALIAVSGSDPGKIKDLAWEIGKLRLGECFAVTPEYAGRPPAKVRSPERVGVDRRVQVLGAVSLAGGPAVVVSCGTALTVDLGDAEGALLGGAILPGIGLGMKALAAGTAQLPIVELKGNVEVPGKDTEGALRAGLLVGAAGAVERLVHDSLKGASATVFVTGQDAALLAPHLRVANRVTPGVGLYGVAVAVRRARGRTA